MNIEAKKYFEDLSLNNLNLQINILKEKITNLEKKDIELLISDFDYTIFSAEETKDYIKEKWRWWSNWNKFILENNLINEIIEKFYKNKDYYKIITEKLKENNGLILTAWIEEFQRKKIKALWLDNINLMVVDEAEEKIFATLVYIIYYLKFIPNKITIYEDRPKYFIENRNFLTEILWIEVDIMFVEMIDNNSEPRITKV